MEHVKLDTLDNFLSDIEIEIPIKEKRLIYISTGNSIAYLDLTNDKILSSLKIRARNFEEIFYRPPIKIERSLLRGIPIVTYSVGILLFLLLLKNIKKNWRCLLMILVFDGSYLLHRSWWRYKSSFSESDGGIQTSIFLTLQSLLSVYNKYPSELVIVAWDQSDSADRRKTIFKEYKGNREEKTEDFRTSLKMCKALLTTMGIISIGVKELEADDIGYLSSQVFPEGVAVSDDRDWIACINDSWKIYRPIARELKGKSYFHDLFNETFPDRYYERYIWYKSLMGDKSDNVPGVRGAGHATAIKFSEYLLDDSPLPKSKISEKILRDMDQVNLNYKVFDLKWSLEDEETFNRVKREFLSCVEEVSKTKLSLLEWAQICTNLNSKTLIQYFDTVRSIIDHQNLSMVENCFMKTEIPKIKSLRMA